MGSSSDSRTIDELELEVAKVRFLEVAQQAYNEVSYRRTVEHYQTVFARLYLSFKGSGVLGSAAEGGAWMHRVVNHQLQMGVIRGSRFVHLLTIEDPCN